MSDLSQSVAPPLGEVTWRTAPHHRTGWRSTMLDGTPRIGFYQHGIRGEHTLCGLTVWNVPWIDNEDHSAPKCSNCWIVGPEKATSHDLLALGLTYRQIDYWCTTKLLHPDAHNPGSGRIRTFPPEEYAIAEVMLRLVRAGLHPRAASDAARNDGVLAPGIRVIVGPG